MPALHEVVAGFGCLGVFFYELEDYGDVGGFVEGVTDYLFFGSELVLLGFAPFF